MNYLKEGIGELIGTFFLVLFGCSSVAVAVCFDEYHGIFQIGIVWGIGVCLAIYATRNLCNAHFNPAVTISMAICKRLRWREVPVYLLGQFCGAFLGGLTVYGLFGQNIAKYELANQIVRGSGESIASAKMFGEYYAFSGISMGHAILAELIGTFILVFMIFALTEGANVGRPDNAMAPLFIGLAVTTCLVLIAPLTQAGLNPARDFAPRLVALMFGWGSAAFPDQSGGAFWVYILAPLIGGTVAGVLYTHVLEKFMVKSNDSEEELKEEIQMSNEKTKVILLGGFLGAGKTTMLWNVAKHLSDQGNKVGLITNDQASELVDTKFLETSGGATAEVSGSCFCCNFNGFTDAIQSVRAKGANIVVAEPVGSCTDLSATIMQPLKEKFQSDLSVAPLSVLADANRLKDILAGGDSGLHKSAAYIVKKQLQEADYILINKIDLLAFEETKNLVEETKKAFPKAKVFAVSAQEDYNIEAWLSQVIADESAGTHLLNDIDYDTYAEGEAVLGWLNATVSLESKNTDWGEFIRVLLSKLGTRFDGNGQAVGHVKILVSEKTNFVVGNLTGKKDTLKVRGASNCDEKVVMTLNARVEMSPEELESIVKEELSSTAKDDVDVQIDVLKCLQPGRPNPTHRYHYVA